MIAPDLNNIPPFLANLPRWVLWKEEQRKPGKPTKVPMTARGKYASSTNISTWAPFPNVADTFRQQPDTYLGVGITLGNLGTGEHLCGIDFDACLDEQGNLLAWAEQLVAAIRSYLDLSPGEHGLKSIFRCRAEDVSILLKAFGIEDGKWGCKRTVAGAANGKEHGPAIEVYLGGRYFTVTGKPWGGSPEEVALLSRDDLQAIAALVRAATVTTDKERRARDDSRSAIAFRLGAKLRREGATFKEMCEAIRTHPDTAEWCREKGDANGGRELRNIWNNSEPPAETPVINCLPGQLDRMYREAEAALLAAGAPIYQRTLLVMPTTLEYDAANNRKTHSTALAAVTAPALTKLLSRAATFTKFDARKNRDVVCDPPPKLVDIILASRGDWRFPVVRGVLTTPTLRPDGSLLVKPGYDPVSRYYLAFPSNLVMPPIPDAPTRDQAQVSLERLDALLVGYAFVEDDGVSRAVALAMLMTQVLRCAMPVSPLLAVSATAPGTGKSHLVDLCSHIAIGRWCPIMNAGKNDEETEKGINTKLISGIPGFSIDNVHRMLDLEALNTATERPLLSPRQFGSLTDIEVENGVVIYKTGNNLAIVGEQRRRTLLCRMDAASEQPEQRAFTSDPMQTVLADRGRYIADVLTIVRAYITNGWKPNIPPLGSYPEWSRFVREPLCWLGQSDPVLSQNAARDNDPEINQRRALIEAWYGAFGKGAVRYATTPPVHSFVHDDDTHLTHKEHQERLLATLLEAFPAGRDGINTQALGLWMRRFEGRITDGLRFVRVATHHGSAVWKLA